MLSPEYIRDQNMRAAADAAARDMKPFIVWEQDIRKWEENPGFPFPFFGDYVPDGWEMVDEYFVDASGLGHDDEPALSVGRFLNTLRDNIGDGYAVTSAGEFQVYVGRYRKVGNGYH